MTDIILLDLDLTGAEGGIGTVQRLCTYSTNVFYNPDPDEDPADGYEYIAVGDLLQIDDLNGSSEELNSSGTTVTLSGVDPAYRIQIDQNGFKKAPIDISIATVEDGKNIVASGSAQYWHRGTCDSPATEIDHESGTMTIAVNTQSVFGNLDRVAELCRTSMSTHLARHQGDRFFSFVASTSETELWIS